MQGDSRRTVERAFAIACSEHSPPSSGRVLLCAKRTRGSAHYRRCLGATASATVAETLARPPRQRCAPMAGGFSVSAGKPFASAGAAELFGDDKHGQERGDQR